MRKAQWTALLALALVSAVLLVTDYLFNGAGVYVFPPLLLLTLAFMWFIRPALRRRHGSASTPPA